MKSSRTDLYMTKHNEMGASCHGGINREPWDKAESMENFAMETGGLPGRGGI